MTPTQDISCEICGIFKNTHLFWNFCERQIVSLIWNMTFSITSFFSNSRNSTRNSEVHQNSDNESSCQWILVEILCVIFTLMSSVASDWKKVQASSPFFSHASEVKNVVLCSNWYYSCSEILSYSRATHIRWMEICLKFDT